MRAGLSSAAVSRSADHTMAGPDRARRAAAPASVLGASVLQPASLEQTLQAGYVYVYLSVTSLMITGLC